jgi:hypothetical protein
MILISRAHELRWKGVLTENKVFLIPSMSARAHTQSLLACFAYAHTVPISLVIFKRLPTHCSMEHCPISERDPKPLKYRILVALDPRKRALAPG